MANPLLSIGSPSGRRWVVLVVFGALTLILLEMAPDFMNPQKAIMGSFKVAHILVGLLWLTFFWIKRHAIY